MTEAAKIANALTDIIDRRTSTKLAGRRMRNQRGSEMKNEQVVAQLEGLSRQIVASGQHIVQLAEQLTAESAARCADANARALGHLTEQLVPVYEELRARAKAMDELLEKELATLKRGTAAS